MKIGIIADDLTGANATGVNLVKKGFRSATIVFGGSIPSRGSFSSIVMDIDSRYATPLDAEKRVFDASGQLQDWGAQIVGKRIDSTARGNIGVEVDALIDTLGDNSAAVVVTSYPDSGRIVAGGFLLVNGIPVQETDVAKDPMNPILNSHMPTILNAQSSHKVAHIDLTTVLKGNKAIEHEIRNSLEDGYRMIVIDAITNEEIDEIADAMANIDIMQLIPVDPGPLTASYALSLTQRQTKNKKWLAIIGSATSLTKRQVNFLADKMQVDTIHVDAEALVSSTELSLKEVKQAIQLSLQQLETVDVIIITTASSEHLDLSGLAVEQNETEQILARRITEGLSQITKGVIEEADIEIGGIFSSGGDLTAALCASTQAEAFELEDEVLPLAAYGHFIGGSLDGMPVVTKGGMVGDHTAIYTCMKYLTSKNLRDVHKNGNKTDDNSYPNG
ncbi:four-carbon acid sugar kinase family protein [Sporosarcina aquimarina]|uniref:Four-carbon acid sugar kinase family protein n=1 Tax=Sporosarcina aquimarina TaxID=114975 RepID=A0ABU4G2G5_9BACL|nr:four-carbon acid sugar kinase family protein [Sporosarcina aquimarina]MDW0111153.1 four-carbon acid sugar kinase family protein [Sporosarcina aquimarina]